MASKRLSLCQTVFFTFFFFVYVSLYCILYYFIRESIHIPLPIHALDPVIFIVVF